MIFVFGFINVTFDSYDQFVQTEESCSDRYSQVEDHHLSRFF